jgi:hypothetical protein
MFEELCADCPQKAQSSVQLPDLILSNAQGATLFLKKYRRT